MAKGINKIKTRYKDQRGQGREQGGVNMGGIG